jgi:hypothetical protein
MPASMSAKVSLHDADVVACSLAQSGMVKEQNLLASTLLTSVHLRPKRPSSTVFDSLLIGTWIILGILAIFALLWIFRWRRSPRIVKRPWWTWFGWGGVLITSVCASLWSVYFLGSGALAWIVPSLVPAEIALYIFWYQQTNQIETPSSTKGTIAATGSTKESKSDAAREAAAPASLFEGGQQTVADPTREDLSLADLRQVINVVSQKLQDKGQVDSIVSVSNIEYVRYPTGRADARQLWTAVFEAALDEPPATLILLLNNIRDSLGARSRSALEVVLREVGLS